MVLETGFFSGEKVLLFGIVCPDPAHNRTVSSLRGVLVSNLLSEAGQPRWQDGLSTLQPQLRVGHSAHQAVNAARGRPRNCRRGLNPRGGDGVSGPPATVTDSTALRRWRSHSVRNFSRASSPAKL